MRLHEIERMRAGRTAVQRTATVNSLLLPTGVFLGLVILLLCLLLLNVGVAERRRMEESTRASERRYRDLVELSPNAIWMHDGEVVTFVNEAGLRLFRAEHASQLLGRPVLDLFPRDSHDRVQGEIARLLREPQALPVADETLRALDGAAVPVEAAAVSFEKDGAHHVLVNCHDVGPRKEAEESLRRLHAELEQRVAHRTAELRAANEELDAFCYAVSHDLRAPLRSIAGFTRIVFDEYGEKLDGEARDYFRRVLAATDRMGELIDDLLRLSRVSREDFHREPVDLTALARDVAEDLQRHAPERSVAVEIAGGMEADGDPRLLRVLLENLLGNAWKFTSKRADALIEVSSRRAEGVREFTVRDNGAGFDMRYAGRLFGPFQRLHSAKDFPGTGIGLATVLRIVHRHGGDIRAEAKPGEGAAFTFTL
jgi:PAS domain S-box-containing protein